MLKSVDFNAEIANDITKFVWLKAVINSAINPIGAYHNVKNGELLKPEFKKRMKSICEESASVALANGIKLPLDPWVEILKIVSNTKNNKCSMLQDIDNNPSTYGRRQIGDTLHSQPAAIVYGGDGSSAGADVVVYAATNDGYLHAIDGQTGIEMWSFIPSEFLPDMVSLYEDEAVNYKHYGIDGDLVPIVVDRNENGTIEVGTDFVYLIFGLRRGGNNYYALDVTNKQSQLIHFLMTAIFLC